MRLYLVTTFRYIVLRGGRHVFGDTSTMKRAPIQSQKALPQVPKKRKLRTPATWTPEQARAAAKKAAEVNAERLLKVPSPQNLKVVSKLAELGMTEANIAYCVGISPSTFLRWKKDYPQVVDALDTGKSKLEKLAVGCLARGMQNNHYSSAMFILKTKFGWRETDAPQAPRQPNDETGRALLRQLSEEDLHAIARIISTANSRAGDAAGRADGTGGETPSRVH